MATTQLTPNAVAALNANSPNAKPEMMQPIVQILSVKKLNPTNQNAATTDRFRVLFSDGVNFMQGMLASQLNGMVGKEINAFSVLRLQNFVVNEVGGRRVVIILSMQFIGQEQGKIGNPVNIEGGSAPPPAQPPQPQHQQSMYGNQQQQQQAAPPQLYPAVPKSVPYQQPPLQQQHSAVTQPQLQQPQQPTFTSAATGNYAANASVPHAVMPIASLNPYQPKWTIKARVVNKSDMRHWNNAKGEGRLFSMTLIDDSGEIKATAFNEAADRLISLVEDNKVYYVSKGSIKPARKQYNTVQNDYEISFDNNTEITPCVDSAATSVPTVRYAFVQISRLVDAQKDAIVDIIGVVKEAHEAMHLTSKTSQRQLTKRDVVLVDQSNASVKLTMWGQLAEQFDGTGNPVVACKAVRVSDYQGEKSLSTVGSSQLAVNPDIPESHVLRGWFDGVGRDISPQPISVGGAQGGKNGTGPADIRRVLSQIESEHLGQGDKPDYFTVKATINFLRSEKNLWYTACPGTDCNKKVMQEGPNTWRCEKCARTYSYCEYRYTLSMNVGDYTGSAWFQCFNDVAEHLLGKKAEELNQMKQNDNEMAFKAVFQEANFKEYLFRVRAKMENYNDEQKVRCSIVSATPVDYANESKHLISLIEQY